MAQPADNEAGEGKRSALGGLWRGTVWLASTPFRLFPHREIARSAEAIGQMWASVRHGRERRSIVEIEEDRSFDLRATAFLRGMTPRALEALLEKRRRATARNAYLCFALAWLFFFGWLYRLAHMPWTSSALLTVLEFAPFCVIFFLLAFKSALQNYQIRTRRLATAAEYLCASESFWPN